MCVNWRSSKRENLVDEYHIKSHYADEGLRDWQWNWSLSLVPGANGELLAIVAREGLGGGFNPLWAFRATRRAQQRDLGLVSMYNQSMPAFRILETIRQHRPRAGGFDCYRQRTHLNFVLSICVVRPTCASTRGRFGVVLQTEVRPEPLNRPIATEDGLDQGSDTFL